MVKIFAQAIRGSAISVLCERMFDLFGIKPNIMHLPTADAARALKDGLISGLMIGWPAHSIEELLEKLNY